MSAKKIGMTDEKKIRLLALKVARLTAALHQCRQSARDAYLSPSESHVHLSHIFRVTSDLLLPHDGGGPIKVTLSDGTKTITTQNSPLGRALKSELPK